MNSTLEKVSCSQLADAQVKKICSLKVSELFTAERNSAAYTDTKKHFLPPPFPGCSEYQHRASLTCSTLGLRGAEHEEEEENSRWPHGKGLSLNLPGDRHKEEGHRAAVAPMTYRPAHRHPRLPGGRKAAQREAAAAGQVPPTRRRPRKGRRARREPLQHLPPGRAIRAGGAGLPHLRVPATNILGQPSTVPAREGEERRRGRSRARRRRRRERERRCWGTAGAGRRARL